MYATVPVNHCGVSRNQQNRNARPILLFHANVFEQRPALNPQEHAILKNSQQQKSKACNRTEARPT